jgi:2-polyprenyl-6-methoxyphenol hydroxylase-like FAD-dependent oxidoreductase
MTADVLIAGGGPAGLASALVLARAGRGVFVVDTGGRNAPADYSYNVFTHDGAPPLPRAPERAGCPVRCAERRAGPLSVSGRSHPRDGPLGARVDTPHGRLS